MLDTIQSYDSLITQINKNIRGLKAHPKILVKEEHKYLYPVFEKAMYVAISASDLIISLKYLDVSNAVNNQIETNFFARNVAHISYELINNQQKIISQDVSKTVIKAAGAEALSDLKNCKTQLKIVTSKYHQKLNFLRNNLFGHRTEKGAEMANSMLEIDAKEIYAIGKKIFDVYIDLLSELVKILKKI